ncbi:MAG: peptidoglycan DD-metalloendopeptidase family protein [Bdellovibrionaceae bacterium]|nr:peptidoglycan DD-metalloendopeptidase family protein [Pseudobdellovibrionaceae bacterium]
MKARWIFLSLSVVSVIVVGLLWQKSLSNAKEIENVSSTIETDPVNPIEQRYPYQIEPKSTFSSSLLELDISSTDIHAVVITAKPYLDLGRLKAGTRFQIINSPTEPVIFKGIRIKMTPSESLLVQKSANGWTAERIQKKVTTRIVSFQGTVKTSLWDSAIEAKMNPRLIADLAEVFSWQVDFSREVQPGDKWRFIVEEELVMGEHIGWASILAADYVRGTDVYNATLFRSQSAMGEITIGYYDAQGKSLKRVFLKTPIQYSRISSRFQTKRFHPILKIARPHYGVDYAAPTGTAIRAVGDGTIMLAARSGGAGNMIKLQHNATYSTAYKHLSRFAQGIRANAKVKQGQTIGYVGSTGLSSGPHLHFEFYVNGKYVDPLGQKFPSADPVSNEKVLDFLVVQKKYASYLPAWN